MADSLTAAVLGGVAPLPRNLPKRVTIEYSPGQTITLEGDALTVWWTEYMQRCVLWNRLTEAPQVASDDIHEMFANQEKEDKDKNKE